MAQIITTDGLKTQVDLGADKDGLMMGLSLWRQASDEGITFAQAVNRQFADANPEFGSAFEQIMASEGMFMRRNPVTGERPPRMYDVMNAPSMAQGVVRPDGSQALTVAGRILFPATILQWVESELMQDSTAYEGVFNGMVAYSSASDSVLVRQPIINMTGPRDSLPQPIAQGAEPSQMMTITLSDRAITVPVRSIGLEVTDQAQQALQIDYIGMSLQQQLAGQRAALINEALSSLINGDTDRGIAAVPGENFSSYDSAVTAPSSSTVGLTDKAWVKWLYRDYWKMTVTDVICELDTYFLVRDRIGRPTIFTDAGNDMRLTSHAMVNPAIRGINQEVNFFIVPPGVGVGANTMIGIDRRKAIHKIVVASATYSAVEQYVMRRSTAMRFDFAETYMKFIPDGSGWKKAVVA